MDIFEGLESNVRFYSRNFPVVFESASGPFLYDESGRRYIDFVCGAGALSYGHNRPELKEALVDYLLRDGVISSLDFATSAKRRFLERFQAVILRPRCLDYRVQFSGPTGANAVEAALKIARKATGRMNVLAFTNSYHGLTAGALAVTADGFYRHDAFFNRTNVSFVPFEGFFGPGTDTIDYLTRLLEDSGGGLDQPAAVVVETIQAEGGVNVASNSWLQRLQALCRRFGMVLIIDDIQAGCGRTGSFFSFEEAAIRPDIVVLSKGISGYGLPFSVVLLSPEVDKWEPGEHTGTFRGNNLAFVAAATTLDHHWQSDELTRAIFRKEALFRRELRALAARFGGDAWAVRGRGLLYGIDLQEKRLAAGVVQAAFARGLIVERCGPRRSVVKFLPPLCCDDDVLSEAVGIMNAAVEEVMRTGVKPTVAPLVSVPAVSSQATSE